MFDLNAKLLLTVLLLYWSFNLLEHDDRQCITVIISVSDCSSKLFFVNRSTESYDFPCFQD